MPLPILAIVAAFGGGALVKAGKAFFRDESPKNGYCTWCGQANEHSFFEDGLTWKKTGPIAILTGGAGTAIAGLVTRNLYQCNACTKRTLPCRMPRCTGMARSTDLYDDELCGMCRDDNNVHAERARRERGEERAAKLAEILKQHEARLRALEVEKVRLEREGHRDSQRIGGLLQVIEQLRSNMNRYREMMGEA